MDELVLITVKNEIAITLQNEKKVAGKKRLPRTRIDEIIAEAKNCHFLGDDIVISKGMIHQRQKRNAIVEKNQGGGLQSPLHSIKPQLVRILIQMTEIRQCLTPAEAIHLINSLIEGTQIQEDLIAFKKNYPHGEDGTVGF